MSANPPRVTVNQVFDRLLDMTVNVMMSRTGWLGGSGGCGSLLDVGGLNLAQECKYIQGEPTIRQYKAMYDEEGVAARIVGCWSDEAWSVYPEWYETEEKRVTAHERAWDAFLLKHNPWYHLHLADEQSGITGNAIVLIGMNDVGVAGDLSKPVAGLRDNGEPIPNYTPAKPLEVTYLQVYSGDLFTVNKFDTDPRSPRYMLPQLYSIKTTDSDTSMQGVEETRTQAQDLRVHWTRIHHVAKNKKSSRWSGTSLLRNLHHQVFDVRKILGSAGQMWYQGGFPGISFETYPELTADADLDLASVKKDIEAYSSGLQRYIRLVGMSAKSLQPQVSDPTNVLLSNYVYICATLKVPLRVFMGTEVGDKASSQYATDWNRRLSGHQKLYVEPMIIRPFIERLVLTGILPEYKEPPVLSWRDLNALSDKDRADVALKRAQAILQYITSGSSKVISPKYFFTLVLGFTEEESQAIIDHAGGEDKVMSEIDKMVKANAGNTPATTGTNPSKSTGAGGRRNGLGGQRKKTNV